MYLLYKLFSVTLILTFVNALPTNKDNTKYIVEDVPKCQQKSEDINDCLKRTMNIIWLHLKDYNPELGLVSFEPIQLNRTVFQYANKEISGRIAIKNTFIHGFSKIQLKTVDIKFDKDNIKSNLHAYLPKIDIVGQYKAEMMLNTMQLKPKGEFNVTLSELDLPIEAEGKVYRENGHRFLRLSAIDVDAKIADLKIQANGIFSDPALEEVALSVVNSYWRDIYAIMLPETHRYWQPLLLRTFNDILSKVPLDNYIVE